MTFLQQPDRTGVSVEEKPPLQPAGSEAQQEAGSLSALWCHDREDGELEDDFASSLLAAISCWHFRVQAFLSTTGAVRLSAASLDSCNVASTLCNTLESPITAAPD